MALSSWGMAHWYSGKDPGFSILLFQIKSLSLAIIDPSGRIVHWKMWPAASKEYQQASQTLLPRETNAKPFASTSGILSSDCDKSE